MKSIPSLRALVVLFLGNAHGHSGYSLCLSFILAIILQSPLSAQTVLQKRDPAIQAMVNDVSVQNIESIIRKLASFDTRHSLSDTTTEERGIGAARRWIKAELERYARASGGRLQVSFDPFVVEPDNRRIPYRVATKNVMARLPGKDAEDDRIFIISGHYDSRASDPLDAESRAPGANDDASGTAVVMELARLMSQQSFPATLLFVAVAGEEQGLYGSKHLARRAVSEGWNIPAMLTNDIVGNTLSSGTGLKDNTHVRVFSEGVPAGESEEQRRLRLAVGAENDGPARQLARYIKEVGERYVDQMDVVLIYRRDRFLRGGDHTTFSRAGYAAVRFSEMNENYFHQHQDVRVENGTQYGDLPEFVDYPYVAQVARINLAVLANLALAPPQPDSVGIVVRQLANHTTLQWKAPAGRRPHGYYVLLRETHAPYWQRKIFVGDVTEVTLPYSKDNFLFAVQSVDAEGHESLPVFPWPVR